MVLILFDDMGFSHLGCYGSTIETPNIDRLAANGVRFTNFHTTALCSPTRACLMTGRDHHTVGMRWVSNFNTGFPHMRGNITPHAATIAELLREEGFATFVVGKWHLAPMERLQPPVPLITGPFKGDLTGFMGLWNGKRPFLPGLT